MSFYFHPNGLVNYKNLTKSSFTVFGLYYFSSWIGISQVRDPGMDPTLRAFEDTYEQNRKRSMADKFKAFCFADKVIYSKDRFKSSALKGKVVAIMNPYEPG